MTGKNEDLVSCSDNGFGDILVAICMALKEHRYQAHCTMPNNIEKRFLKDGRIFKRLIEDIEDVNPGVWCLEVFGLVFKCVCTVNVGCEWFYGYGDEKEACFPLEQSPFKSLVHELMDVPFFREVYSWLHFKSNVDSIYRENELKGRSMGYVLQDFGKEDERVRINSSGNDLISVWVDDLEFSYWSGSWIQENPEKFDFDDNIPEDVLGGLHSIACAWEYGHTSRITLPFNEEENQTSTT